MQRTALLAGAIAAVFAVSANAQPARDKEQCRASVEEVVQAQQSGEYAAVGPRAQAEVDRLIEVARHLCDSGNFVYADTIMQTVRGMLSTE